jgi:magnesium transporter|tara:strand:- start:1196 stop:2539 length:1344 start_codon:yes stop_codon:yes gene_type:complete
MSAEETSLNKISYIKDSLSSGTYLQISRMLNSLNPADIAHFIESSPPKDREFVWQILNKEIEGEVLIHLSDTLQKQFLKEMDAAEVAEVTGSLATDELADIIQRMPEAVIEEVLSSMSIQNRIRIEEVLAYPEDSAGGLMNTDVIAVRKNHTLDVVMRYLRMQGSIPESTNKIFVVNRKNDYLGSLNLNKLLISDLSLHVGDIYEKNDKAIMVNMNDSEVARAFEQDDLISAPVVDDHRKLVGRITIDDVVDVIREDADETLRQLSGLEEDTFSKTTVAIKSRALWLGLNLITAFIAASFIDIFKETIAQVVTLAVLMPIVASMGGVAATQTLTIMVRGMALGQIGRTNIAWLIRRETLVGLSNGILWAIVVGFVASWWFQNTLIAQIIAFAMIFNLLVGVLSGVFIPLLLKAINLDPGVGGTVIVTTITDVTGFVSFLGLASIFLL